MALVIPEFRKNFPEFGDTVAFPDARINFAYQYAVDILMTGNLYCGDRLTRMLDLLTAHILTLMGAGVPTGDDGAIGTANGAVISATVGDVSVSFAAAPARDSWQHWLQGSGYGQLLAALMRKASAGGLYFGGTRETQAIRQVGGRFQNGRGFRSRL